MELGATVCFRQNPLCTVCPVSAFCAGLKTGDPGRFPQLAAKKIEKVTVTRLWFVQAEKLLLHRAAATARRLAHLHELPTPAHAAFDEAAIQRDGELLAQKKRAITKYQITESIYRPALAPPAKLPTDLVWVPLAELESVTLSGPHRRWVREILARQK